MNNADRKKYFAYLHKAEDYLENHGFEKHTSGCWLLNRDTPWAVAACIYPKGDGTYRVNYFMSGEPVDMVGS